MLTLVPEQADVVLQVLVRQVLSTDFDHRVHQLLQLLHAWPITPIVDAHVEEDEGLLPLSCLFVFISFGQANLGIDLLTIVEFDLVFE